MSDLETRGFVKLDAAFGAEHAAQQRALLWRELEEREGIREADRSSWHQPSKQLRQTRDHPMQEAMATERLLGALDQLLGVDQWTRQTQHWGSILFTFPNAEHWDVPRRTWHWDSPIAPHRGGAAGIQMFSLLAPMHPGGGATVFIEGMHHVLLRYYAALSDAERRAKHGTHRKRVMNMHPWLRELRGATHDVEDRSAHFMERDGDIDGMRVRVREMTGDPGDVYLLHPLTVHCWAPNARDTPRIMRTKMINRLDFDWTEV